MENSSQKRSDSKGARHIRWCSDHLELKCRNGEIGREAAAALEASHGLAAPLAVHGVVADDGADGAPAASGMFSNSR